MKIKKRLFSWINRRSKKLVMKTDLLYNLFVIKLHNKKIGWVSLLHDGTLLHGDSFAREDTFARASPLHEGTLLHGEIYASQNFSMASLIATLHLYGDNFSKRHFYTA